MKTKILFLTCIVCALVAFVACSDDAETFDLSGDCLVEKIVLDEYEGVIDHASRTITVTVPEIYEKDAMKVTKLRLSEHATCDIHEGDVLNMEAAVVLHVVNGDVFMDRDRTQLQARHQTRSPLRGIRLQQGRTRYGGSDGM